MYLAAILTSSSENASGVQTIQVLGVWSASPVDKLSDNNSCRADIEIKKKLVSSTDFAEVHSVRHLCTLKHYLDYLKIKNIVSKINDWQSLEHNTLL